MRMMSALRGLLFLFVGSDLLFLGVASFLGPHSSRNFLCGPNVEKKTLKSNGSMPYSTFAAERLIEAHRGTMASVAWDMSDN